MGKFGLLENKIKNILIEMLKKGSLLDYLVRINF